VSQTRFRSGFLIEFKSEASWLAPSCSVLFLLVYIFILGLRKHNGTSYTFANLSLNSALQRNPFVFVARSLPKHMRKATISLILSVRPSASPPVRVSYLADFRDISYFGFLRKLFDICPILFKTGQI
jgi:hypothetical protein